MEYITKINPGDEVWTMSQNKPHQFRVASVEITISAPNSPMRGRTTEVLVELIHTAPRNNPQRLKFNADLCFATKQELCNYLFNTQSNG